MHVNTLISEISPIGKRLSSQLKRLGLNTVGDLLYYFPYRHDDWSKTVRIANIIPNEPVTVRGKVEMISNRRSRLQKIVVTEAIVSDQTGKLKVVWFHQPYLPTALPPGTEVFLSGRVEYSKNGAQFTHPIFEKAGAKEGALHTARIVPLYPLTERLSHKQLRFLISLCLPVADRFAEWVPEEIVKRNNLCRVGFALKHIHFPDNDETLLSAQHRLKFEELFLISSRSRRARASSKKCAAVEIQNDTIEIENFLTVLGFKLTNAQTRVMSEILSDMGKPNPMNRILEGDVGSGKTAIAAISIFSALKNNCQCAYMAPTEILARQHFEYFKKIFSQYNFEVGLFSGAETRKNKKVMAEKLVKLKNGEIQIAVGTHALIQDKISFNKLGLVVVDEQHRFGVQQRAMVAVKGNDGKLPHFLSMTATPIPRTLALTLYGELDVSIIDELPAGRKEIKTSLIPPEKRGETYSFVKREIECGRQAYIICPLVDPTDKLGKKAATEEFEKLRTSVFPNLRIGLVHGKLKPQEKDEAMQSFYEHRTDILVATAVIEVGVNVPNATVMIIESAERFGLAQLHQFRGRVGRGTDQSYCFLFTESISRTALNRLYLLTKTNNGFELAEKDLEFRGPGETYGVSQHGFDDMLKVAKLTDYEVIDEAQKAAEWVIEQSEDLSKFETLSKRLDAFEKRLHME